MSKEHPTPWSFQAEDDYEDQPILDANGREVLVRDNGCYPPDLDTCREIVEAMNNHTDFDEEIAAFNRRIKKLVGVIRDLLPLADMFLLYQEAMKQAGAEQIRGIGAARDAIRQFIREAREIVEDEE